MSPGRDAETVKGWTTDLRSKEPFGGKRDVCVRTRAVAHVLGSSAHAC